MDSPAVLQFRVGADISFTLIGQLDDIGLFLGDNTRSVHSSPLIFEFPDGTISEPPQSFYQSFYKELADFRAYLDAPDVAPLPSNLNLGHQPFPDELRPILSLLPEDLRFQEHLYFIKPSEDLSSILTFVPMQNLKKWMASQELVTYRNPAQAVRDMYLRDPQLFRIPDFMPPSVAPYPRVRAYPRPRSASRGFAPSASPGESGALAICIDLSGLEASPCVRMADECTQRGTHVWIVKGGKGITLTVKIIGGPANLRCDRNDPQDGVSNDKRVFRVDKAQARLEIVKVGPICKYLLTNACPIAAPVVIK